MKAVVWHGTEDVRVDEVPDPAIQEPTDAIVRITSTAICGSDLHLYRVLTMYMEEGDILGHEPMGIVEEVGSEVTHVKPGDRVVLPFNIACGHCFMCGHGLQSQCETTQVHEHGKGAALFGYTKLYGAVAGRTGRVSPRASGPVWADQGAGRPGRRALPLLVRRAPDGLAGRRIRGRSEWRHACGLRARSDRPVVRPGRQARRRRARHRRRSRAGAKSSSRARYGAEILEWTGDAGVAEDLST